MTKPYCHQMSTCSDDISLVCTRIILIMNGTLALLTAAVSGLLSKQCSWLLAVLSQHPRVIKHYTGPAGPRHTGLHRVSATTTPCRMQGLGSVTQVCTGCPARQHPVGSVSAGVTVSSSCLCLLEHMSAGP